MDHISTKMNKKIEKINENLLKGDGGFSRVNEEITGKL